MLDAADQNGTRDEFLNELNAPIDRKKAKAEKNLGMWLRGG